MNGPDGCAQRPGFLMVANWPSDVGYAWWLMESFWVTLAKHYHEEYRAIIAFPSLRTLSESISSSPIAVVEQDFRAPGIASLLSQLRFLRRHRIRVMYLTDWRTWSLRYALFRLAGVRRIVTHDHTPGTRTTPRGVKRTVKRALNQVRWWAVDGAFGATDFVRKRLVDVGCMPAHRCYAVPNGIPDQCRIDTSSVPAPELLLNCDDCLMVMVARANRYKNIDFVLDCLVECKRRSFTGVRFLFIGDGPDLGYFKSRSVELGVSDSCIWLGFRTDVQKMLTYADFAIHPSSGEVGYSLSILEYMAAGLPVLVPDDPSVCLATKHGETGFRFPKGEVARATDLIIRMCGDESSRRAMGRRAKHLVGDEYDLCRTHSALVTAFNHVLQERCFGLD